MNMEDLSLDELITEAATKTDMDEAAGMVQDWFGFVESGDLAGMYFSDWSDAEWAALSDAERYAALESYANMEYQWELETKHIDGRMALPRRIGETFALLLQEEIGITNFKAMAERNRAYDMDGQTGVCASHDFCDANMVMHAAILKETGMDFSMVVMLEEAATIWNKAWDYARKNYLTQEA